MPRYAVVCLRLEFALGRLPQANVGAGTYTITNAKRIEAGLAQDAWQWGWKKDGCIAVVKEDGVYARWEV